MRDSYQPYHVIVFIIVCLMLLGAVVYLMPSGRQKIIGDYEFRFISENKLLKKHQRRHVDLDSLIADIDTTLIEESIIDTAIIEKRERVKNYSYSDEELLTFNEVGKENFRIFFDKLESLGSNKARILHYGDSQLEGDRMTSFIRQRLQEQFGGYGPGFIPTIDAYRSMSFKQQVSENFQRYTNFGGESLTTNRYGILNSVGRFTPEIELDSTLVLDSLEMNIGWVSIAPSPHSFGRARKFNHISLHYCDAFVECELKIYENDELIITDSLVADGDYHNYRFDLEDNTAEIRFEFSSKISPNILGFSLDADSGIQMDNIAMRGSSGTFFGKIDQDLAKQIYEEQNVEMIIMQFGGNSMPYIKDSSSVKNVVRMFKGQLNTIRRLVPNAMVLVIGPSDMSTLIEGEYETYPLLPYYVDRMKNATHEIGGAYFDMYSAMGGEDAMVAWVEKGWAAEDYIHFSPKGARLAAQKFYDVLMTIFDKLKENEL